MRKKTSKDRKLALEAWGNEPGSSYEGSMTSGKLSKAYNWYHYMYDDTQAKTILLKSLKELEYPKEVISSLSSLEPKDVSRTVCWISRILTFGATLPETTMEFFEKKLKEMVEFANRPKVVEEVNEFNAPKKTVQDRIREQTSEYISELEDVLDTVTAGKKTNFDSYKWLREKNIKAVHGNRIVEYYMPIYSETVSALKGEDEQYVEAYSSYSKKALGEVVNFLARLLNDTKAWLQMQTKEVKQKKERKKRATKQKDPLRGLTFMPKCEDLKVASIVPSKILGAKQIILYNTKYRFLTILNTDAPEGLNVRGTTIYGFDEEKSFTKKLRKPENVVPNLVENGKVTCRRIIEEVKSVSGKATGRVNEFTLILKAF